MSFFEALASGAQRFVANPLGVFNSTIRVGVTGLSRAGKTAFLTSLAANMLARQTPRFALAPMGAGDVPRFDYARHLAALAADPPRWPERTNAVSVLALTASIDQSPLPARRVRLEFLDYPGEWLIDLPLLSLKFSAWSADMLKRLEAPAMAPHAREFLAFVHGLPARAPGDEALARAGAGLYRRTLESLRDAGMAYLQPGRVLMPAPGPEPPWMEFFPLAGDGRLAGLMGERYAAYVDRVRRDLASPLFADVDRLVVLADVLTALHAGPAAFEDTRQALAAAAGALRWRFDFLAAFSALTSLRLPPRVIDRVAFAATKADHVAERQRGNLSALMKNLTQVPGNGVKTAHFALASVRCTEDHVLRLEGRPVSAVRGRVLGQDRPSISYPGEVPDQPPDDAFWQHPFLALPVFEPMRLPEGGRFGVPNINMDALLAFLLSDVL
jgi:predicted YcjX-like family ATPase